ncbi:hypothetical protein GALMADRAFT_219464 [Galerina marginata CBS 339.88]|uniref:Enoyl reductase (ER) domain-containing protein n=1 Tax=Galerina marginata (strain CBS 339.88) TaxID=685588 RepID=A0A067TKF9_GALM3|nr:hypothetical protein GALMADRAFT_219464 [Galerina marginata CBS 339.88]
MSTSTITPAPGAHLASVSLEKGSPPVIVAVSNYVPGVGELVVRVKACGVNPGDIVYPYVGFPSSLPMICGADVVGIVRKVGAGVQGFVAGDRVAGYSPLHWSMQKHIEDGPAFFINGDILKPDNKYGGFQEQTVMLARGCIKVPTLTIEQAATLGCGFSTAGEAFWNALHYPRPSKQSTNHGTLLVWGGSGSIGAYAIQFAKLAGIRVITAASPRHREYLLSIGAENVFDYNDPKAVEKKEGVENVLDTVSKVETTQACLEVLQGSKWEGKKKIAITLFMKP